MQLKDYIGEATAYDKKLMLERKDPTSWLKSVSAFANTQGGRLLFGVANDGALVGLADAQEDAEFISETIKMQMDPVPEIALSLHDEDGKRFVVVEVKAGSETPYYMFVKGHRDAFIRIGNESVRADAIQLKRLVLKNTGRTWDVLDSPFVRTNYAFDALRAAYFKKAEMPFEENDFKSFGLVSSDGFLTNAGALFADDSPIRHSRVFCTRWRGLTKADGVMEAIDDHEYSGSLLSLLNAAKLFVETNSKMMWRKKPGGRDEFPEYPRRAYEEGIVNALIHRDYLEVGSEVHIDMFDDRMEIFSPGGMPSGDIVQDLGLHRVSSLRRNPVIADLFQRLDLMERRGSGFGKILRAYDLESQKRGRDFKVLFSSIHMGFTLVLPNLNYGQTVEGLVGEVSENASGKFGLAGKSGVKAVDDVDWDVDKNVVRILDVVKGDPHITQQDIATRLNLSLRGVEDMIKRAREKGLIRRVGGKRFGHWEVVK